MYRGFNLSLPGNPGLRSENEAYLERITRAGKNLHSDHQQKVKKVLAEFITPDGALDASKMRENWFPTIKSDVFISHSHADEETAILLAGWMKEELGLVSFIDSCAWGYATELLALIDKKFCYKPKDGIYSYEKRNLSTSHVHMMLSTALSKMIDEAECLFFLNTPHSITPSDVIEGADGFTTSPWIYSEIATTRLIQKKLPHEHRGTVSKALAKADAMESFKMIHNVSLAHLTDLSFEDLDAWIKAVKKKGAEALDVLYDNK
jgi:hypothetical protein